MAENTDPSPFPGYRTDIPGIPQRPLVKNDSPQDEAKPLAEAARGMLWSVIHAVIGGLVGLTLGVVAFFVCIFLFQWNYSTNTFLLLLGLGLLFGVAFSSSLVRMMGLAPTGGRARAVVVGGREGRSEIELVAGWLLGLVLIIACGWGLIVLSYYLALSLKVATEIRFVTLFSSLMSLGLMLLLEHHYWLSRLMGLRITPGRPAWKSAVFLWLFGVPGLLFRSSLAASPAPEASKSPANSPDDAPQPDGVREIIETIVFVVVLVLMLKSFAAEAFVIPTGSMAETLLGYQKMTTCPKCGYVFPVNCSQEADPTDPPPVYVRGCTCPNCREHITYVKPDRADGELGMVAAPGCNSGDRVLVSKFAYDLFERAPDREDVVVFKYPGDNSFPNTGPFRDGVAMNYIKRLVGLSRETIAIHNGDLYALSPEEGPQYDDLKDITDPTERAAVAKELWQKKYMHVNESVDAFDRGEFHILRKAPSHILAMRRIVYDNDHQAKDLVGPLWTRWLGRDGDAVWTTVDADSHGFHMAPTDDKVHWLSYRHILRDNGFGSNGQEGKPSPPQLITDFMGYNSWEGEQLHSHAPGQNWVGDLILDAEVQTDAAQGELTLELSKGVDRFRARWDLSTGVCTLSRVHDGKEETLDSKPTNLKGGGTHQVRFGNVDERLTVWVDEALPFGDGVPYKAPETAGATKENDLQPASIGVKGTGATVRGVRLWRDTYYTTGIHGDNGLSGGNPGLSDVNFDPADPTTWGALRHMPTKTLYIQPDHYLCMGDNSPESSDGRTWGAVPKRLLLGKALAVYWPADRFGRIR